MKILTNTAISDDELENVVGGIGGNDDVVAGVIRQARDKWMSELWQIEGTLSDEEVARQIDVILNIEKSLNEGDYATAMQLGFGLPWLVTELGSLIETLHSYQNM